MAVRSSWLAALLALVLWHQDPASKPAPDAAALPPVVKPYQLNFRAESFHLADLAGADHPLCGDGEDKGKALLLCFFSFRDPVSRAYVPALSELQAKNKERLSVYLVDSNCDELVGGGNDPLEALRRYAADEKLALPILIDKENRVADDFRATANAQVFLLDAGHVLRYFGGIDDDPGGLRRKKKLPVTKWLEPALEIVLAGNRPEFNWTRTGGRPIKRAPKGQAAAEPETKAEPKKDG